jgi:hypothetical protein
VALGVPAERSVAALSSRSWTDRADGPSLLQRPSLAPTAHLHNSLGQRPRNSDAFKPSAEGAIHRRIADQTGHQRPTAAVDRDGTRVQASGDRCRRDVLDLVSPYEHVRRPGEDPAPSSALPAEFFAIQTASRCGAASPHMRSEAINLAITIGRKAFWRGVRAREQMLTR